MMKYLKIPHTKIRNAIANTNGTSVPLINARMRSKKESTAPNCASANTGANAAENGRRRVKKFIYVP